MWKTKHQYLGWDGPGDTCPGHAHLTSRTLFAPHLARKWTLPISCFARVDRKSLWDLLFFHWQNPSRRVYHPLTQPFRAWWSSRKERVHSTPMKLHKHAYTLPFSHMTPQACKEARRLSAHFFKLSETCPSYCDPRGFPWPHQ